MYGNIGRVYGAYYAYCKTAAGEKNNNKQTT